MSDTRLTQPTFTGGEISDELYGRKDFARYQVAVKYASNIVIHATGGMSNRAGLRLVGEVKDHANPGRLLTFEAAGDDAFLLVCGHMNVRPVASGSFIDNGGVPLEIATPYSSDDLTDLYIEQSNDVATLTHPAHMPRELSRYSALVWTVTEVTFIPQMAAPGGVVATTTQGYTGYDSSKLPSGYDYKVSAVSAETGEESLPSDVAHTSADLVFGYDKNFVTITWTPVAGAESYYVFKATNGVYGSLGTTPNASFKDSYISPDFTTGPQEGYNPFTGENAYPSIAFFSQQRRGFARTNNNKQTVWMTQSGNFKNMSRRTPTRDDDAIEFTLAAQKKQDIYHVLSIEKGLIVFTRSGEWRVTGSDGVITPSSILPEPQSQYGAAQRLKPMIIGEAMLFVGRDNRTVYEMEYSFEIDRYTASDLTLLAKHLFKNRSIKAWAHAADPDGVTWCVMSDGKCASLTYLKEHDVWGWSRHETKGRFLDVAVVPEVGRDVPYFLIQRRVQGGKKVFVEMLADRVSDDMRNAFFVDCGLSYDVPLTVADVDYGNLTRIRINGHGLVDGDEVELDGFAFFDQQDNELDGLNGRYIVEREDANWVTITHAQMGEGVDIGQHVDSSHLDGAYADIGVARKCVDTISGLDHLNGREVVALADGFVIDVAPGGEPLVVTDGSLPVLDAKFARIHVGLSYRSKIQTLDLVNTRGDDNGIEKAPGPVYARFINTRGVKVGFTEDSAVELHSRLEEGYYDPAAPKNGNFQIEETTDWGKEIEVWFIQDDPLPCTVLGVTIPTNYGGDGG